MTVYHPFPEGAKVLPVTPDPQHLYCLTFRSDDVKGFYSLVPDDKWRRRAPVRPPVTVEVHEIVGPLGPRGGNGSCMSVTMKDVTRDYV